MKRIRLKSWIYGFLVGASLLLADKLADTSALDGARLIMLYVLIPWCTVICAEAIRFRISR
jgi:hypothetical protein